MQRLHFVEGHFDILNGVRVVIPAFNAEGSIGSLLEGISRHTSLESVYVVDDGSSDPTSAAARNLGANVLRHELNRGKGAALITGLTSAFSDSGVQACLTMDADGQHEPAFIPAFVEAFRSGAGEMIIGSRRLSPLVMPWPRVISNRLTSALIGAKLRQNIEDSQCGYRLISRKVFSTLSFESTGFDFESEMLIKAGRAGMRIGWVPISTVYGTERSYINGFRDTWRFVRTWFRY